MAIVDLRQRSGYVFLAVVLAQVIIVSAQVGERRGVPLFESIVFGVFAGVQRGVASVVRGTGTIWTGYVSLRGVRAENDGLRRQLADAQVQLQEQRALAARSHGLEQLLKLRDETSLATLPAEVIAAGASPDFRTLTLDKGTRDGVTADQAVLAPSGVVGRIVVPSGRAAKVQLLIDRNAAAGALIERSRAQGVLVGGGDDRLRMEYVSEVSDVVVGDVVVTSGIDGIYPKGFILGRVETVERSGGAFRRIVVRPAVDFSSLEAVVVVLTPTPARAAEGSTP